MATTFSLYSSFKVLLASGAVDFESATVKAALVTSAYTPSSAHNEWSDVSSHEMSGAGYSAGGAGISDFAVTADGTGAKIDASDVIWSEITSEFRYIVVYISGTVGGLTNPLVGYLVDSEGDITTTASPLEIEWSSDGLISVS